MKERGNKTIMCSVLFLDIVEYSKKSVSGQIALKDAFNAMLSIAIRNVPLNDRIILDTGDGAAISFLGDVEDALKASLVLREKLLSEGAQMQPPLLVRMGINLGPVRLVRDINGQPNIVGDGINVAQRVMGFADAGQVLVSRSYFDAVSHVSSEHAALFSYQGSRTDKHVRDHEVYAVGSGDKLVAALQKADVSADAAVVTQPRKGIRYVLIATVLVVMVIAGFKLFSPVPERAEAVVVQPAVVVPPAVSVPSVPVPEPVVEKTPLPPVLAKPAPVKSEPAKQLDVGKQDKSNKKIARVRTVEETTPVVVSAPGVVSIAVSPWGEIYLDGRMQGVSPPLAELQVLPGKHDIEIRNTTFPSLNRSVTVNSGETIKIKHKFTN